MNLKNIFLSFIVLFGVWLLLNCSLASEIVLIGLGISAVIVVVFCRNCDIFTDFKISPKSLLYSLFYIGVFLYSLIISNLDVARRVLTPSLPIEPGIVKVRTVLKSKLGRMILANSITLTPGTLSVDIRDEFLYIHCISVPAKDVEQATEKIVRNFEKYLEVIYG